MAYAARVLQILIASPGDVQAERQAISDLIYEWNYNNSRERSIVLLPIRWETHASPELGARPQAIINKQVVDACDMAVAVFWTRLGTPTGEAESGTAEEISRMGNAGKPVMLYFSDNAVRLATLDIPEYQRLREFKNQTYPRGLIETYSTLEEFRDKFRRQLAAQISSIIATDTRQQDEDESATDTPGITLGFASAPPLGAMSPIDSLELTKIICTDGSEIPDYTEYDFEPAGGAGSNIFSVVNSPNREFYRQIVNYTERIALRHQLRLALSNTSIRSVRDIHLDIRTHARSGHVIINPPVLSWPSSRQEYSLTTSTFMFGSQQAPAQLPGQITVQNIVENEWYLQADVPIVQAQRTVYLTGSFTVSATEDSVLAFDATVYTIDALPFALSAELEIHLKSQEISYREILREMVPGYDESTRS